MQVIVGFIVGLAGVLSMIGSFIAMKFWLITVVIMTILKLTGVIQVAWFAGMFTAGAISTGLWMLFGGLVMVFIGMGITALGAVLMDS